MLSQDQFVAQRRGDWRALETLLASKGGLDGLAPNSISQAAALYRSACADLMRARTAGYGLEVTGHLDILVGRAHNQLYRAGGVAWRRLLPFLWARFPQALRRSSSYLWVATALFVVPLVIGVTASLLQPEVVSSFLPRSMLEQAAASYAEELNGRPSGTDATMAGFYVHNNVGIAFRCFATGILFGVGSIFFLVYNGLLTGMIVGWVIERGHGDHILTFVCGHAAFELTAICIAGAAGLQMGYALVRTHGKTRLASLRDRAPDLGALISGAAAMLLVAAAVEAFWSPSSVAPPIKWGVAALLWLAVVLYLALAGRHSDDARRKAAR